MKKTVRSKRTIKVKQGALKYKLQADDGTFIGELTIELKPNQCEIWISKKAAGIDRLGIAVGGPRA